MTPPSPLQAPERSAGSAPPAPSAGSAVSFVFDGSLRKLRSLWTPSFVFDGSLRKLRSLPPPRRLRGAGTLRRLRSTGALRRLRGVVNVDGSLRKLRSLWTPSMVRSLCWPPRRLHPDPVPGHHGRCGDPVGVHLGY